MYVALAGLTGSHTEEVQGRGQRPVRNNLFQKIAQRNNKRLEPRCLLSAFQRKSWRGSQGGPLICVTTKEGAVGAGR